MPDNEYSLGGYDFSISETQEALEKTARGFALEEIKPYVMEWDEAQIFPRKIFRKLGDLGLMGILTPKEYGGAGLGYIEYAGTITEIAKVCGGIAFSIAAHCSLCASHIVAFGSEKQKQKWLPKLASGEWIGAWALTEAAAGSDSLNINLSALADGEHYIVNGSKSWITHGMSGDIAVVMVRTETGEEHEGISALVIERGTPGFSHGKKENKLGMRASETTALIFEDCRVPKENLLGKEGDGFKQIVEIADGGRISVAALSLGIARGAFDAAVAYSKERRQFAQPIANFQSVSFKLADLAAEIEAAELLIMQASDLKNRGINVAKQSAMAKYFASELAVKAATEAVQIFGSYGCSKDYPVEKYYRDAKLCTIGNGTSEIQKRVISKEILK